MFSDTNHEESKMNTNLPLASLPVKASSLTQSSSIYDGTQKEFEDHNEMKSQSTLVALPFTPDTLPSPTIDGNTVVDFNVDSNENTTSVITPIQKLNGAVIRRITHGGSAAKHALRQQARRRRRNTSIATGNSPPVTRVTMKPGPNSVACLSPPINSSSPPVVSSLGCVVNPGTVLIPMCVSSASPKSSSKPSSPDNNTANVSSCAVTWSKAAQKLYTNNSQTSRPCTKGERISPITRTSLRHNSSSSQQQSSPNSASVNTNNGAVANTSQASTRVLRVSVSQSSPSSRDSNGTSLTPMQSYLAAIPGFKLRKRSQRKMSAAAQLAQTEEGNIDLETPDSILATVNLRNIMNKHTLCLLPPAYQHQLMKLLPKVDQAVTPNDTLKLSSMALNNEFFGRACESWRCRLMEGEFTHDNQIKLKAESEKERTKLDPWKVVHFEPMWGTKTLEGLEDVEEAENSSLSLNEGPSTPNSQSNFCLSSSPIVSEVYFKRLKKVIDHIATREQRRIDRREARRKALKTDKNYQNLEISFLNNGKLTVDSGVDLSADKLLENKKRKEILEEFLVPIKKPFMSPNSQDIEFSNSQLNQCKEESLSSSEIINSEEVDKDNLECNLDDVKDNYEASFSDGLSENMQAIYSSPLTSSSPKLSPCDMPTNLSPIRLSSPRASPNLQRISPLVRVVSPAATSVSSPSSPSTPRAVAVASHQLIPLDAPAGVVSHSLPSSFQSGFAQPITLSNLLKPRTKQNILFSSKQNRQTSVPGNVNLKRSYEIINEVIANSPHRDQLRAQLRSPNAFLNERNLVESSNIENITIEAADIMQKSTVTLSATTVPHTITVVKALPSDRECAVQPVFTTIQNPHLVTSGAKVVHSVLPTSVNNATSTLMVRPLVPSSQGVNSQVSVNTLNSQGHALILDHKFVTPTKSDAPISQNNIVVVSTAGGGSSGGGNLVPSLNKEKGGIWSSARSEILCSQANVIAGSRIVLLHSGNNSMLLSIPTQQQSKFSRVPCNSDAQITKPPTPDITVLPDDITLPCSSASSKTNSVISSSSFSPAVSIATKSSALLQQQSSESGGFTNMPKPVTVLRQNSRGKPVYLQTIGGTGIHLVRIGSLYNPDNGEKDGLPPRASSAPPVKSNIITLSPRPSSVGPRIVMQGTSTLVNSSSVKSGQTFLYKGNPSSNSQSSSPALDMSENVDNETGRAGVPLQHPQDKDELCVESDTIKCVSETVEYIGSSKLEREEKIFQHEHFEVVEGHNQCVQKAFLNSDHNSYSLHENSVCFNNSSPQQCYVNPAVQQGVAEQFLQPGQTIMPGPLANHPRPQHRMPQLFNSCMTLRGNSGHFMRHSQPQEGLMRPPNPHDGFMMRHSNPQDGFFVRHATPNDGVVLRHVNHNNSAGCAINNSVASQITSQLSESSENSDSSTDGNNDDGCPCNMKAMLMCMKCGAFCHHDCINSAQLCMMCLIR